MLMSFKINHGLMNLPGFNELKHCVFVLEYFVFYWFISILFFI